MSNRTAIRAVQRLADQVEREAEIFSTWQSDLFGPPTYEPARTAHELADLARRVAAAQVTA